MINVRFNFYVLLCCYCYGTENQIAASLSITMQHCIADAAKYAFYFDVRLLICLYLIFHTQAVPLYQQSEMHDINYTRTYKHTEVLIYLPRHTINSHTQSRTCVCMCICESVNQTVKCMWISWP